MASLGMLSLASLFFLRRARRFIFLSFLALACRMRARRLTNNQAPAAAAARNTVTPMPTPTPIAVPLLLLLLLPPPPSVVVVLSTAGLGEGVKSVTGPPGDDVSDGVWLPLAVAPPDGACVSVLLGLRLGKGVPLGVVLAVTLPLCDGATDAETVGVLADDGETRSSITCTCSATAVVEPS